MKSLKSLINKYLKISLSRERVVLSMESNKSVIVEFVGPSGSGKTTNFNYLLKHTKKLKFKKTRLLVDEDYSLSENENQKLYLYIKALYDRRRMSLSYSKGIKTLIRKFFFSSYLSRLNNVFILDEGLYKLFVIDLFSPIRTTENILTSNICPVFFEVDNNALYETKYYGLGFDKSHTLTYLEEYYESVENLKKILKKNSVPYLVVDGYGDLELNLSKIETFIHELIKN